MPKRGSSEENGRPLGPRGGTSTRNESGMYRKNFWLSEELTEALRRKAFKERRSETDIMREALERLLNEES